MAQAARLNLRMQKELKLLLTDPPPGASFPLLSADPDSNSCPNSLSTIDAQIEGPEGTVYADGMFHVKIQIPERYPFQPPSVTFSTPIYHPNIDNGGRICLDILNLPPKGAWQPSLNISTVLTSIGLLLSEPNPDDGLMCDASREYKYNRQAFDQKARSMTEKYAKAGATENSCRGQSIPTNSNTSMMDFKTTGGDFRHVDECVASQKNICRSMLLNSSGSAQKRDNNQEVNEGPNGYSDIKSKMLCSDGKKLPLGFRGSSQTQEMGNKENVVPVQMTSLLHPTGPSMCLSTSPMLSKVGRNDSESGIGGLVGNHKKCMIGRKLSLGSLFQSQGSHDDNRQMSSHSKNQSEDPHMNRHTQQHCKSDNNQKLDCDHGVHIEEQIKRQKAAESPISESVIVLDSEDSEDEGCVSFQSKSLLARKRIGKWKAIA